MAKLIIGVIVAAVVVIVTFMIIDPNTTSTLETNITESNGLIQGSYKYTVEGEVSKPATYLLDEDITMQDLIDAAGGLTSNADECAYFEDTILDSAKTYFIASKYDATDICSKSEITKVNINEDDADTLTTINGITNAIASSIVSYRVENGYFQTVEDLLEVYGIGNATYRKVRNYVILHE